MPSWRGDLSGWFWKKLSLVFSAVAEEAEPGVAPTRMGSVGAVGGGIEEERISL